MKRNRTTLVACLLVVATVVPAGSAVVSAQDGQAYAGTHVEFETNSNAIVDYSVNGETAFESMKVQSQSTAESEGAVGADAGLSAVTEISAAPVSLGTTTELGATVSVDSGATVKSHDNSKGILVVRSGGESQYVTVDVSSSSQASSESDERAVITTADGTKGTFLVVGDGSVTVNEEGDISADLGSDSKLVFRSYPQERGDAEKREERLITEGKAAAEVYLVSKTEGGSEVAADVVQYSEDTTVEVTQQAGGTVEMTAQKSESQGEIIITSVSEQAIESVDDLQVTVDGNAAVEASSYSELESTIDGADSSAFLVRQRSSAQANADVLVAVNHFSERTITMQDDGGSSGESDDSGGSSGESDSGGSSGESDDSGGSSGESDSDESSDGTSGNGPGFGVVVALVALIGVAAAAARRE